ncbi:MAG: flagellar biosynthesis anti-sigma factor FlgM [Terriglobia bacterium]|jgi:flagellar biosynthesis anti-sigma factor FlgM
MRVDGPLSVPENLQTQKVANSGSSAQQSSPASIGSSQDQAQLSLDNNAIQQLKATLSQVPEVRQERVQALSQAVSNGSFQVSDQQLSDAIGSDLLAGQL